MLARRKTLSKTARTKIAWFFAPLLLLATVSCAQNQKLATDTSANETVVSATPPFQTKEPERYRATRTITTVTATGQSTVTTNLIARDGELRRYEFELASQPVVQLIGPEGKFMLLPKQQSYAELTSENPTAGYEDESDSSPDRLLHTEPSLTSYQRLGAETTGGRATQKYRVVVNSSAAENVTVSESVIWIDETLHMPIKSETTSNDGRRVTMELTDIATDVDRSVFQIPKGYEKITILDFARRLNASE